MNLQDISPGMLVMTQEPRTWNLFCEARWTSPRRPSPYVTVKTGRTPLVVVATMVDDRGDSILLLTASGAWGWARNVGYALKPYDR